MMDKIYILFLLIFLTSTVPAQSQDVKISENEKEIALSNKIVTITFDKQSADLKGIVYNGISLLNGKNQRAYLMGPGFSMSPSVCKIVRKAPGLVELSFYHEGDNHFQYDLHYVLMKDLPGIYCFLVQSHHAGDSTGDFGQTRWGIRSDESLFDYHLVRDSIQGPMPKMSELGEKVQDWTYKMDDGTIYTKYNYADYIDGRYVHGMAGIKSGLGMFVIQPSHEYLNGGPTKQYQNVHSNPYLIEMFNCGHFLNDRRNGDNLIGDEWVKLNGPFLLYFNKANNTKAIWEDAKRQAEKEKLQWPYSWMVNKEYPQQRGTVKGQLLIDGKPAVGAHIILAQPGTDWQAQSRGYIFNTDAQPGGVFELKNVRPGKYTMYAYGCNTTTEFQKADVAVMANKEENLGVINWSTVNNSELLWQLGKADRKTTGFKLSDHKREYGLFNLPPDTLRYVIGKNVESDWYYAQTKKGHWDIVFDIAKPYTGKACLTIGIAGSAKNPTLEVWVNDQKAGSYNFGNDASIYRSAVAGGYYLKQLVFFPSNLLKQGTNIISFKLPNVKEGGGIMYDVVKLEITK